MPDHAGRCGQHGEGHNWDNVNNVILTSYTWAADKIVQCINRVHRLTSQRDVKIYDQSADRVLEDNINEKTNSSELAIDGRLLGEVTEERSISELLRDAMRDFKSAQACPDEAVLAHTWPALREQLKKAANRPGLRQPPAAIPGQIDLTKFIFPVPATVPVATTQQSAKPAPSVRQPLHINLPSWRRVRLVA